MRARPRAAAWALVAIAAAGCGGTTGGPSGPTDGDGDDTRETDGEVADTPEGAWELVASDPSIDVPEGARVTLTVTRGDGGWSVGGTAACNSYGGEVRIDGDSWRAGDGFGVTEMACEPPRMDVERAYLDAFTSVDAWARSDEQLTLTGSDVILDFELLPPVPTAALTTTRWSLESLRGGAGPDAAVSSTAADADDATLRLHEDGTVDASTGCRSFSGTWVETGDEVLFDTFGVRDDSPNVAADGTTTCSPGVVDQEDHVLSVLGDGFRADVDGDRLTLTSRDGLGLTYRASNG